MPRYESRVARIDSDITTFWLLSKMSWIATKLYNTALWNAKETWNKQDGQVMAIDLGMRNPIVSMDEEGNNDIFKGGKILSDLRYWNKEKARIQTDIMRRTKGKKKSSKSLVKMSQHGARQVKHAIHSMTNKVVELCVQRNVKEVVIGDLTGIKKNQDGTGKNWSDKPNQNYAQIEVSCIESEEGCSCVRTATPYKMQTIPALIRRGVGQGD